MIQRIQSVYLVLGAICLAALFLFDPLWAGEAAATLPWFMPALLFLIGATATAAVVAIFLYKDRKKQRKVVVTVQIMSLLLMATLYGGFFLAGQLGAFREGASDMTGLLLLLLPITAYILFYLARKGIEKDIALVRSMDRLR